MIRTLTFSLVLALATQASATTFDLATATDLVTPSFRGAANSTYLGWDTFDADPGEIINDNTPDVGTDTGWFRTTNGQDHLSGSLNYYSGGSPVAEDITFSTDGVNGSGFTTVIVQAKTLFGGWGSELTFSPINGVTPSQILQTENAAGSGQFFVKYELPGTANDETFSLGSLPGGPTSFGIFTVDTYWSATGYAADNAIATPEPSSALLLLVGGLAAVAGRRS